MAKLEELKEGLYILSKDVKNPKRDKRARPDGLNAERWKAGTRILVRVVRPIEERPEISYFQGRLETFRYNVTFRLSSFGTEDMDKEQDKQFPARTLLLEAMEPKPMESAQDIFFVADDDECHSSFYIRILERLRKEGKISTKDIVDALKAVNEED